MPPCRRFSMIRWWHYYIAALLQHHAFHFILPKAGKKRGAFGYFTEWRCYYLFAILDMLDTSFQRNLSLFNGFHCRKHWHIWHFEREWHFHMDYRVNDKRECLSVFSHLYWICFDYALAFLMAELLVWSYEQHFRCRGQVLRRRRYLVSHAAFSTVFHVAAASPYWAEAFRRDSAFTAACQVLAARAFYVCIWYYAFFRA